MRMEGTDDVRDNAIGSPIAPNAIYPDNGSRTCCHGLIARGERTLSTSCAWKARMMSGTMRLEAQSPPPKTFPERAEATRTPALAELLCEKKEARNDATAISIAALLALYGSRPPSGSCSR